MRHDADHHDARDQQEKQRQHGDHAGKTEFLGQYCKNKIGMRLRKIKKLLDAGTDSNTEKFSAPDGDQRLGQLEPAGIGISPGIHEADDAAQPVRLHGGKCKSRQGQHTQHKNVPPCSTRQPDHAGHDGGYHRGAAHIGLHQQYG